MEWSPELLIASHDEDEQNSRLAQHLWEDNGLDIPEAFLGALTPYLGMISGPPAQALPVTHEFRPRECLRSRQYCSHPRGGGGAVAAISFSDLQDAVRTVP